MSKNWSHAGRKVSIELRTTASAEQVWTSFADPARIVQWFADEADGKAAAGGWLRWRFHDFEIESKADVLEAIPDRRLVLSIPVKGGSPRVLQVEIDQADGKTRMQLTESGFPEGEAGEDVYQSVVSG